MIILLLLSIENFNFAAMMGDINFIKDLTTTNDVKSPSNNSSCNQQLEEIKNEQQPINIEIDECIS